MTIDQIGAGAGFDVVTQLRGELDAAKLTIEVLRNDISTIATFLRQEAEGRGWCSEYLDFVETVNGKCSDAHLQPCGARWRLTYQVIVEVTSEEDLDVTERQLYGELHVDEIEGGCIHRTDVTIMNRERVEE